MPICRKNTHQKQGPKTDTGAQVPRIHAELSNTAGKGPYFFPVTKNVLGIYRYTGENIHLSCSASMSRIYAAGLDNQLSAGGRGFTGSTASVSTDNLGIVTLLTAINVHCELASLPLYQFEVISLSMLIATVRKAYAELDIKFSSLQNCVSLAVEIPLNPTIQPFPTRKSKI